MCGIGSFQLCEEEAKCAKKLAQNLLRGLQIRGTDASGIAWHDNKTSETMVQKHNCNGGLLASYLDADIGRTAIVHTRYATLGSPKNNDNNHPIDVAGVVGVHNGHVTNHKELFAKVTGYKRKGQVDSEAIFAYLRYGPSGRSLADKLSDIEGGAAIMWLQTNSPKKYLHIARLTSSPLVYGRTKAGSVICASTEAILRAACKASDLELSHVVSLDEGVYLRFQNGELTRALDIPDCRKPPIGLLTPPFRPAFLPQPNNSLLGSGIGGEFRNGKWMTRLDLLMEEAGEQDAI